jgi:hypothetical protein
MDQVKRYVWPIATAGAVLVILLIGFAAWISPEGHKVSAANADKVSLQGQETTLQAEIFSLQREAAREPKNCSTLRQDLSLIPSTPTVDLFLHQISQLATNAGTQTPSVSITSSGTAAASPGTASSASAGSSPAVAGADTVGITLGVSGTYRQVLNFLNGLDNQHSLQRLYSVSSVTLDGPGGSSSSSGSGYTLQLVGDIYYSTAQADVCSSAKVNPSSTST